MNKGLFLSALIVGLVGQCYVSDLRAERYISQMEITADGERLAYVVRPSSNVGSPAKPGEVEVVLRDTVGETERRFIAGDNALGAGNMKLSSSGRWVAFGITTPLAGGSKSQHNGLALIASSTGRRRDFSGVRNFDFVGKPEKWLALQGYPQEGSPAFELTLQSLKSATAQKYTVNGEVAFDPAGNRVAWSDLNGLSIHDLATGATRTVDRSENSWYVALAWSKSGKALAAIRIGSAGNTALIVVRLDQGAPRTVQLSPQSWKSFPASHEIVSEPILVMDFLTQRAPLIWRNDEEGIFINVRPMASNDESSQDAARPVMPNLALWHWRDNDPPKVKPFFQQLQRQSSYLGYVDLRRGSFIRLADEAVSTVYPHEFGQYLIGFDAREYERVYRGSNSNYAAVPRDYFLIELGTAKRIPLAKKLWVFNRGSNNLPRLSPDGSAVLYQQDGDFMVLKPSSGIRRNLTAGLAIHFYYEENQRNQYAVRTTESWLSSPTLQGWSMDGRYVLVSDNSDVWALPLGDGKAINMTGNGRQNDIVYTRTQFRADSAFSAGFPRATLEEERVDLKQPVFFTVRERHTARTGIARRKSLSGRLEVLWMDDALIEYRKAASAPVYVVERRTSTEPTIFSVANDRWRPAKKLVESSKYSGAVSGPASIYLSYPATSEGTWNAVLFPPKNYIAGQAYPMIAMIYESMTWDPHTQLEGLMRVFNERGYAMLFPHISPRVNEAGQAALEGVTAAVNAAISTGIVDRKRLGLTGHSYGAYETYFIATQTDLFKAVVPMAGITNLWKQYGENNGGASFDYRAMETNQSFLAGPWWDHWQAYLDNSPLYHAKKMNTPMLIVHGDQDTATPFNDAAGFFANLHRMGDKPVVMLQYVGENHISIEQGEVWRDVSARMLEFYDHFLKDAPAPKWWQDGVSIPAGQVPLTPER